jgi:hypothetical protein
MLCVVLYSRVFRRLLSNVYVLTPELATELVICLHVYNVALRVLQTILCVYIGHQSTLLTLMCTTTCSKSTER